MKEVVQTVNRYKTKDSVVLICPSWLDLGFSYYYNPDYFKNYKDLTGNLKKDNIYPVNEFYNLDTTMINRASTIIYFEEWATLVDPDNQIFNYLENHFSVREQVKVYESFTITHFSR